MGWEERNGRCYYYRKRRVGNTVISEYVGPGWIGELGQALDGEERFKADVARAEDEQQREVAKQVDRDLAELHCLIKSLTRATFLLAGFHPHKGQWRKLNNV